MKVDFNVKLKDLDGRAMKEQDGAGEATLRSVSVNALLMPYPDEQGLEGTKKAERYDLAMRIHQANGEALEMKVEEVAELKRLIGKGFTALVVGQAWRMLESQPEGVRSPASGA